MQHDLVLRWLAWATAPAEHSDLWKRSVSDDGNTYQLASPVINPPAEGVDSSGQLPDDSSIASTTSSTRNLAALERTSVRRRSFNGIGPLPRELRGIASQLQRIGRGQGIISKEDREEIVSRVRGVPGRRMLFADLLEPSVVDQSGSRRKVGTLPSVLELLDIKDDAEASFLLSQSEAHWNSMVHGALLSRGLRHSSSYRSAVTGGKAPPSIRVYTTTDAQIALAFMPAKESIKDEKQVDFCLALETCDDPATKDMVHGAALRTPYTSINHTNHFPLRLKPITLSIKTQQINCSPAQTLYEMSTWLSAQWIFLQSLIRSKEPSARKQPQTRPPFLPGIIIEGHRWTFVAATLGRARREGGWEVVIWTGIDIGTTETLRGMAQIVAALQILADWSVSTYWPWFEELISEDHSLSSVQDV